MQEAITRETAFAQSTRNHAVRSSASVVLVGDDASLDEFDVYATVVSAEDLFARAREQKRQRKA